MKKIMMTALVATMASGSISAFAGAALQVERGAGRAANKASQSIRQSVGVEATGAKVGAAAAGSAANDAKYDSSVSVNSAANSGSTKVGSKSIYAEKGPSCDPNSAFAKVEARYRDAITKAFLLGLGGTACAEKLESVETVRTLGLMHEAGVKEAAKLGIVTREGFISASVGNVRKVLNVVAWALMNRVRSDIKENEKASAIKEGLNRLEESEENRCDFVQPGLIAKARG